MNNFWAALSIILPIAGFIVWDIIRKDKAYKIRYASILHRMRPRIHYPIWRLEEMLMEENEKSNK